ncbi:LacI family DNA-binding transcriptional regulator [Sporosarcina aquimarina]|uniref:LacI family DNA-binding transcriptional regulator n=1 Tax=Sporosarcina aquimarina TaxID=114975 RepID=UPI001C8D77B9|nr:LacI family DNA-binding transcriptional regulator [Sporosarcina aquimarina]MBY0221603.1 LacI family DNA-binding transcriptional regulator [Sporosarcina aquimarina]
MVTIKDVAKKASVSIATVSAVINNNKFVSDELKERVEIAIKELKYRPNKVARSLKNKKTNLIGVIVTEITNPFYPLMLKGVEDVAKKNNYQLIVCTTDDDPQKEYDLVQSMLDYGIDGVVLATIDDKESKSVQLLEQEEIVHVLINRSPEVYSDNSVLIDSYKVGEIATTYLIDLEHDDIAFIGGDRLNSREREKGFKNALAKHGVELKDNRIIKCNYDAEKVYQNVLQLIEQDDMPTAFFAASDTMAFATIKVLLDKGFRVPQDISVIGSDNISFSEDFLIPLTTVDAQAYEMGRLGCETLISLLNESENNSYIKPYLLEPSLVVRKSCQKKMEG